MSRHNDCDVDPVFSERFASSLKTLETFALVDMGDVELDDVLKAVGYVSAVSEIKSQIYLGDAVLYEQKAFKKERKRWLKWYDENKCNMTTHKADSLHRVNLNLRPEAAPN